MSPEPDALPATRRRGPELENALLDAARDELIEGGYGRFTIEGVAARAATSRHVIYRRWPSREELAIAAMRRDVEKERDQVPDTGSVRGDLIAMMTHTNDARLPWAAVFSVQLGAYYQESGRTPADLRLQLVGDRPNSLDVILQRGVARGEIDAARLTPRVSVVPIDLFRHELMMTLKPVPMQTILEIVDDIFLPLVAVR